MKNQDIARVFGEIADLLELGEGNAYRVIAYRNAERELRSTGYDTGTSKTLEKLRKDYPAGILHLLRLAGVGPKRVRLFYEKLGVGSLDDLERAIRSGRLRSLGGFGAKSEQRMLEAIQTVKSGDARRP